MDFYSILNEMHNSKIETKNFYTKKTKILVEAEGDEDEKMNAELDDLTNTDEIGSNKKSSTTEPEAIGQSEDETTDEETTDESPDDENTDEGDGTEPTNDNESELDKMTDTDEIGSDGDDTSDGEETEGEEEYSEEEQTEEVDNNDPTGTKNKALLQDSIDIYYSIKRVINKINNFNNIDTDISKVLLNVKNNFVKLQDLIYKFITEVFKTNTYVENLYIFNFFIQTYTVNIKIIEKINVF